MPSARPAWGGFRRQPDAQCRDEMSRNASSASPGQTTRTRRTCRAVARHCHGCCIVGAQLGYARLRRLCPLRALLPGNAGRQHRVERHHDGGDHLASGTDRRRAVRSDRVPNHGGAPSFDRRGGRGVGELSHRRNRQPRRRCHRRHARDGCLRSDLHRRAHPKPGAVNRPLTGVARDARDRGALHGLGRDHHADGGPHCLTGARHLGQQSQPDLQPLSEQQ